MKKIKMLLMALVAVIMGVTFVACDSDDNKTPPTVSLKGRWYNKTESHRELLMIQDDNSVVANRVYNYESWEDVHGFVSVNGNEVAMVFEDGNNVTGTFTLANNTLTINTSNGVYEYSKLADETNLAGSWNYSNITFAAKAIKDEIVIPGGTVNGVVVPPTVMQTAQLSGKFIEYAAQRYFRNIVFNNNGTFTYNVLKNDADFPMTKNYAIDGVNMTVTGETAGHDIESTFKVMQSLDQNTAYFIFDKETVADMFIGYALMLFEGGVAPDVTGEALDAYKKAFTEAYDYYSVEFVITREM
ncbi:MAG: hypothetical protein IKT82_00930 [Bacteroidaceae bacterium]|nr:hypothetical protein [Bacteroidaceae bacterium]